MKNKIQKKKRKSKSRIEDIVITPSTDAYIQNISKTLTRQIDSEIFRKKYAPVKEVLYLIGAGVFVSASIVVPNLPRALKPFIKNNNEYEIWKRFNIPYLKRTLKRLEIQRLVDIDEENGMQIVRITDVGKKRILKYALERLVIKKPNNWNGKWTLISYDIPMAFNRHSEIFREYLKVWRFYPLHKSVFLHAYPCESEVAFLREYLGISKYVRIFNVSKIENDFLYRDFFGV